MSWDLTHWALVIVLFPLVGFVIQVFFGKRLPRNGDWVPTTCIGIPFVIACGLAIRLLAGEHGLEEAQRWQPAWGQGWLLAGTSFQIDFGILVDNLTIVMLIVVTTVSFLVHVYSMGYMHGEVRYGRFFTYLGLFSFSMLGLCVADNLLFLFIFWELVGLCSYFLIGFYFETKPAQSAAIKAFMTTRFGDLGLFLGILIIGSTVGSLEYDQVFASVQAGEGGPWGDGWWLGAAAFCLFVGAMGKSAQFPLHIWLPDAMEGPTPVSALIHAATMVAAGVYLIGRMFPVVAGFGYFDGNPFDSGPLLVVALIGAFTAFFAATIAFAQTDIKKVLAYSTISQLGYMFVGLGVGTLAGGLFHLLTHAFFKALLFLGSGSVIHAVHSNEMDDMGGLYRKMPVTYGTFLVGTLAIAGLPLLSGFWSKEVILGQAYGYAAHHGDLLHAMPYWLGIITAGMTCFYMFRLLFRTFHGRPGNPSAYEHAHESPRNMTVPLLVLAVLAVVAGGEGWLTHSQHWFEHRVNAHHLVPVEGLGAETPLHAVEEHVEAGHSTVMGSSIGLFLLGLVAAGLFFLPAGPLYGKNILRGPVAGLHFCLRQLWFVDRILVGVALGILHGLRRALGLFDLRVIDGLVNLCGTATRFVTSIVGTVDYWGVDGAVRGLGDSALTGGRWLRRAQTGLLQVYVYASVFIFAGVVLVSILLILMQAG